MRHIRPDVSHRVRRQPSIFSARWFRVFLGVGVALVLALLVGPWIAGWFGSDLPRSLFLLAPWSTAHKAPPSRPPGSSERSGAPSRVASAPSATGTRGTAAATGRAPAVLPTVPPAASPSASAPASASASPPASPPTAPLASRDAKSGTGGSREGALAAAPRTGSATPAPATPSTTAPSTPPSQAPGRAAAPAEAAAARSGSLTAPPSVYWVQVGAFLDHKNADRLAERIRGEGLAAATSAFEQSRVLYRVLLAGPDEGSTSVPDEVVGRAKGLGHTVETTADGPAVTGAVPLRKAVETSHALRQQGFRVRLKQEVSSSTFRVVKVGSFATVAEAEAALATLTAKGVEGGIVVRER